MHPILMIGTCTLKTEQRKRYCDESKATEGFSDESLRSCEFLIVEHLFRKMWVTITILRTEKSVEIACIIQL